jgi:hypothetical protein
MEKSCGFSHISNGSFYGPRYFVRGCKKPKQLGRQDVPRREGGVT